MSWTDAEHHCAKQGGHLAMAGVSDISTYVGARVPDDGCRELWIGLNDRAVAGAYAWVGADDGDDVADDFVINLQTTSPGSADGSCVFVGVGCQAEVVAAACDEERSFVCRLSGASLEACAAAPDDVPSLRGFGGAEGSGGADDAPPLRAPGRRLRGADKKTTPSATKHTGS